MRTAGWSAPADGMICIPTFGRWHRAGEHLRFGCDARRWRVLRFARIDATAVDTDDLLLGDNLARSKKALASQRHGPDGGHPPVARRTPPDENGNVPMRIRIRMLAMVAGAAAVAAISTAAVAATSTAAVAAPTQPPPPSAATVAALRAQLRDDSLSTGHGTVKICAAHKLRCQAVVVTASTASSQPLVTKLPIGYGATELEKAYGLRFSSSRTGTIVVIGAGAYPSLEADLAVYRKTYGLPACTAASGCFKQLNYRGGAPYRPSRDAEDRAPEEEVGGETALDVDLASAACPKCKIISMQVPLADAYLGDTAETHAAVLHFATGVSTAKKLGASAVSISYGYPTDKYSNTGAVAKLMTQPGLPIVSSSGDSGFLGTHGQWPQDLPTVTSAGGTSLYAQPGIRGYTELAWNMAGSGCTPGLPPANGQPKKVSSLCQGVRTATDVSAVADPYTGVAMYDSYAPATHKAAGFLVAGGTSASSPFIAGLYARAPGNPRVLGPNTLYAAPSWSFNDVTIGTNAGIGFCPTVHIGNAVCDAGPGWDGPTGVGSPKGLVPFSW
jgi:hypothetical protein